MYSTVSDLTTAVKITLTNAFQSKVVDNLASNTVYGAGDNNVGVTTVARDDYFTDDGVLTIQIYGSNSAFKLIPGAANAVVIETKKSGEVAYYENVASQLSNLTCTVVEVAATPEATPPEATTPEAGS